MKVLQKIIFTFAMVLGLSLAVSAQKDDPKKPPPKPPPPVIYPGQKPPKSDDKPKKPGMIFTIASNEAIVVIF